MSKYAKHCPMCQEDHSGLCPPFEVRTTGMAAVARERRLFTERNQMIDEIDRLEIENEKLRAGAQLGPIVGAEIIIKQKERIRELENSISEIRSEIEKAEKKGYHRGLITVYKIMYNVISYETREWYVLMKIRKMANLVEKELK